jgi:hypothetical protein
MSRGGLGVVVVGRCRWLGLLAAKQVPGDNSGRGNPDNASLGFFDQLFQFSS